MISKNAALEQALGIQKKALAKKSAEYEARVSALLSADADFAEKTARLNALGASIALTALSGDAKTLAKMQQEITTLSNERAQILANAGIEGIKYDCELCKDTGYIEGKLCECVKCEAKQIMLLELSKELPIAESTFEGFDLTLYPEELDGTSPRKKMTQILKLCKEYVISFDPKCSENLLFLGSAGLGKTHLSLSIVSGVLQKGYDVIYGSAYNLFSAMENEHFVGRTNDSYMAATECDLLVIDDLGGEFVSPYIQSLLYNIVNTRLLCRKPTIISTNLSMAEIENRYTPRVSSRFLGSYNAKKFFGKDIRQIKAVQRYNKA